MSDARDALTRLGAPRKMTPREAFERVRHLATGGFGSIRHRNGHPGEVIERQDESTRRALKKLTADDVNHDTRIETFLAYITPPSLMQRIARRR